MVNINDHAMHNNHVVLLFYRKQTWTAVVLLPCCWYISLENKERKNFAFPSFSGIFELGKPNGNQSCSFLPPVLYTNAGINLTSH